MMSSRFLGSEVRREWRKNFSKRETLVLKSLTQALFGVEGIASFCVIIDNYNICINKNSLHQ